MGKLRYKWPLAIDPFGGGDGDDGGDASRQEPKLTKTTSLRIMLW